MKPSPAGVCWSLHFLKNVGRGLTISVTFTRGAAPAGAQPPGSAAQGTLHKVWIPTTGCTPQDAVELHPAVRTAESRREWGMLLLPINQRKADFIPCTWQNPNVNAALHVCSYLTSARKGSFPGGYRKLKNATSFTHHSPPHSLSGSSSCLWPIAGGSKTSIHPTAPSPSWALPMPPSTADSPDVGGLGITRGMHSRDMLQVQQEQIFQRTAPPEQDAVVQFMSQSSLSHEQGSV